jgi:Aspartyl protease
MKKNILLLIFFLPSVCRAQSAVSTQPEATFITSFSFRQLTEGIIVVKAQLRNIPDTLNFVFDTGCGGISLDSTTCLELEIPTTASDTIITGMGEAHKANFVFGQTLYFPGLAVNNLSFHVNDYSVLSSVYGEKIDGIIGYSFFSHYIVKIDYDSLRIDVYNPGKIQYPENGTVLHPAFDNIPIQPLEVKDAQKIDFNFYFDTGAGLCFLMSENFIKDTNILLPTHHPVLINAEGLGGKLQMHLTVVKQLKIGGYKFNSVPAYLYEDTYNATSYPRTGGLIGNDLLRRFNLIINYPAGEIDLLPNGHFDDPFDYVYTGFSIYRTDNKIMVDDIISGSPAERARLQKGDILVGIGDNFSNNIQQYRNLLQYSKERRKLIVFRNGRLLVLFIKPVFVS